MKWFGAKRVTALFYRWFCIYGKKLKFKVMCSKIWSALWEKKATFLPCGHGRHVHAAYEFIHAFLQTSKIPRFLCVTIYTLSFCFFLPQSISILFQLYQAQMRLNTCKQWRPRSACVFRSGSSLLNRRFCLSSR